MTNSISSVSRRWLYIPWIIALIIVIAYYAVWRFAAGEIKNTVLQWASDQRAAGVTVEHGAVTASGFPFLLQVEIERPFIDNAGEWRWRADALQLHALPYELNRIIIAPKGEQTAAYAGIGEWLIADTDIRASLASDKTHGWKAAVTINDMSARRPNDDAIINMESLVVDLIPDAAEQSTVDLNMAIAGFAFASLDAEAALEQFQTIGTMTKTQHLQGDNAVDDWRRAGGTIYIEHLAAILDDNASINAKGRLFLDTDHFVAGDISANITNPSEVTRALVRINALPRAEAEAAATGLSFMAAATGGKITVPLKLKNGKTTLAGIPIGDAPKID